jgi:hypothetical protein
LGTGLISLLVVVHNGFIFFVAQRWLYKHSTFLGKASIGLDGEEKLTEHMTEAITDLVQIVENLVDL